MYRTPDRIFINLARSQETGDRRQEVRGKMWGEIIQKARSQETGGKREEGRCGEK
ncbi:hypothetical protein [Okeania hirsuta]|uniref:hypothetical protein n=1 Tax=Okeania hirsuta TaxID=1458930 RepID=UPI001374A3AB|nr:hypothetical protein [Okeania hirsuta]